MTDVLVEFNGWNTETEHWVIIDRQESPAGFAVFGGDIDPDNYIIFTWSP